MNLNLRKLFKKEIGNFLRFKYKENRNKKFRRKMRYI